MGEPTDRWFEGSGIRVHGLEWSGPDDGSVPGRADAGDAPGHADGVDPSVAPTGPAVLMLHGVGGNAWIWDGVGRRLAEQLPDHRIVAIDQRDGGDTDHPPIGYARSDFIADIVAVHDRLGGRPMVLVGHSRGGWLAAAFVIEHPERVARLVLVDPARLVFETSSDADAFYGWVAGSLGPFESEEAALAWAMAQDPAATWTPIRIRSFLSGLLRDDEGRLVGKLPPEAVPQLRHAREGGEAVTRRLASIEIPTLLVLATRQTEARRADKLAYAERIPGVAVVELDGSHFVHAEVPDEVAAAIARFVAG